MSCRIGIGYDIHRLVEGRKLFLGGIEIPYIRGLLGHSDGDVLLHAICDALLGATGEEDIGQHFPDTDPKYQGIASRELLKAVDTLIKKKNYLISNIDTVVIAQEPMLSPFKKQIEESIAKILDIGEDKVNVKAKTNEGLGDIGRKEAIAVYAVVMVRPKEVQ
ncbi:MAG: 2-C-methyl-D-erythritol 2,4-cyclodiphosphate synthase [Candidatus Omnitrophica bacterium]|nr:2-C-methyl-D-erythritol 2,4-cyclodiphosphate synthase [Candidatus Omnitrophota bacterium]MDD5593000.1 2-C-methyl-D-erythritol 2,4-cyclodiphosphate synthase [Candidatus Omnitrophota bacterium]